MKKFFSLQTYSFFALLFFALISPVLMVSDANAAGASTCTWTAANTPPCAGPATPTDGGPSCSTRNASQAECENIWGSSVSGDANNNAFVTTMCRALKIITGNGGKAFAAFAIISLGIGFFTGKVSWGLMIGVAAGIAAMFGAPTIVAAIGGGSAYDCSAR